MNSLMKLLGLLAITLLAACQGPSGGGTDTDTGGTDVNSGSISQEAGINAALFLDGSSTQMVSLTTDQTGVVEVAVYDEDGNPVPNEIVNFSVTIGQAQLSQNSDLTDSSGRASVRITRDDLQANTSEPGVVSISSDNFETQSIVYQFVSTNVSSGSTAPSMTLAMALTSTGVSTNRISSVDSARVTITLLDGNGDPIENELINLSATSGDLSQPQTLTNSDGQFVVTLEPPASLTQGTSPGLLTATSQSGIAEPVSITYEFVASTVSDEDDTSSVGSIAFVSANPQIISLKGTGGAGYAEVSQVQFIVKDNNDQPISGVRVDFTLSTTVGGLSLQSDSAITSTNGIVTAFVNSGTIATPVRVTASVVLSDGTPIFVQSDLLTLTTGIPDQNSVSLSLVTFAPEAWNEDGITTGLTMRLADRFNNPVPDGTVVNFTTEGGRIDGSCVTTNSACSVTWESQDFRPADHRVTVLATVIGHETYYDKNGSGVFDDGDTFDDLAEAFRDDDENGIYDPNLTSFSFDEKYIDYNGDGVQSAGDGLFNGVPCNHSTLCAADANNIAGRSELLTTLNESATLIMAASNPSVIIRELLDGESCLDSNGKLLGEPFCKSADLTFAEDEANPKGFMNIWVLIEDTAALCTDLSGNRIEGVVNPDNAACLRAIRQSAPTGSNISITADGFKLEADGNPGTIDNTVNALTFTAVLSSDDENRSDEQGTFSVEVTVPSGIKTEYSIAITDPKNPTAIVDGDENLSIEVNTRLVANLLDNLSDEDSDSHSITGFTVDGASYAADATATIAGFGSLEILADGTVIFEPEVDFEGFVPTVVYAMRDDLDTADTDTSRLFISVVQPE